MSSQRAVAPTAQPTEAQDNPLKLKKDGLCVKNWSNKLSTTHNNSFMEIKQHKKSKNIKI